jgi:dipeptidase E
MKYYLSSYKLGAKTEKLTELAKQTSGRFAYIPNARDFTSAEPERKKLNIDEDMGQLRQLGLEVELLDLRDYFGVEKDLRQKLLSLGGVYVSGGNTFVLRQAMKLSGLDNVIIEMSSRSDFIYSGYSAGVCVLCPSLRYYAITDDANDFPYPQLKEQVWNGLGILDFVFEPHYHSDHPESASTDKEIELLIEEKVLFKAYKDGEVLIIE